MSDYENEDECWSALESFRVKLISVIDPSRITPYLRQCKVLNPDDEEQVLSDPNLVIRKRKVGQCRAPRFPSARSQPHGGCCWHPPVAAHDWEIPGIPAPVCSVLGASMTAEAVGRAKRWAGNTWTLAQVRAFRVVSTQTHCTPAAAHLATATTSPARPLWLQACS